jgi:diacylglycerol O-acyltransferase / wax synthase
MTRTTGRDRGSPAKAKDVVAGEERMLHSDAFAWYMENDPVLRSTVVAVIRLERSPDWDQLRFRIDRLTRLVPKLRMRVQEPPLRIGPPRWTLAESFDLDFHLRRARVPDTGSWPEIMEFARTAAMGGFDRTKPLWEFTLLEGMADGGAALVTKLHHSLTDGIGGVQLAALVVDAGPDAGPRQPLPAEPEAHHVSPASLTAHSISDDAVEAAGAFAHVVRALPGSAVSAVRNPFAAARGGMATTFSIGRFVAPVNRQASKVFGQRRTGRLLATLDVPFMELHAAAAAAGCKLNDAYLAALTEGIQRYHTRRGEPLREMRFTVPVSIRDSDHAIGGNRITLIRITVPAVIREPAERIRHIAAIMRRWRHEPALGHAQEIAFGLNLLPRAYLSGIFKRIEVVASDVPGMPNAVWLAGAKVTGYYGFGPTIGSGLNVTLVSYAGTCNVGVNIDTGAVDDPQAMLDCLREGFEQVLAVGRA